MSSDSDRVVLMSQFPRPSHPAHCFNRVNDQVQDHLLQLDPISLNRSQALLELRLNRDIVLCHFAAGDDDHVADRLVNIQTFRPWRRFLNKGTDSADNGTGPIGIVHNAVKRFACFLQIRRPAVQKVKAALALLCAADIG